MLRKISITMDDEVLKRMEKFCEKRSGASKSGNIEYCIRKAMGDDVQ